jgi:hypothetical protein
LPSCSIDGTDFLVQEKTKLDRFDYSHKLKHAGLRYAVAISLGRRCRIVHICGGVPCGANPDAVVALQSFTSVLPANERALADKGYTDKEYFMVPIRTPSTQSDLDYNSLHKKFMARHETVNDKLKEFSCLRQMFRHDRAFHVDCFSAVANIVNCYLILRPLTFPRRSP